MEPKSLLTCQSYLHAVEWKRILSDGGMPLTKKFKKMS